MRMSPLDRVKPWPLDRTRLHLLIGFAWFIGKLSIGQRRDTNECEWKQKTNLACKTMANHWSLFHIWHLCFREIFNILVFQGNGIPKLMSRRRRRRLKWRKQRFNNNNQTQNMDLGCCCLRDQFYCQLLNCQHFLFIFLLLVFSSQFGKSIRSQVNLQIPLSVKKKSYAKFAYYFNSKSYWRMRNIRNWDISSHWRINWWIWEIISLHPSE